jgi:hypothetical protein
MTAVILRTSPLRVRDERNFDRLVYRLFDAGLIAIDAMENRWLH